MQNKILPHSAIILSAMYFVFFFIDRVNQPMAFINNGITKGLLFLLCVISILNAISLIRIDRRRERQQQNLRQRPRPTARPRSASPGYDRDERLPRQGERWEQRRYR